MIFLVGSLLTCVTTMIAFNNILKSFKDNTIDSTYKLGEQNISTIENSIDDMKKVEENINNSSEIKEKLTKFNDYPFKLNRYFEDNKARFKEELEFKRLLQRYIVSNNSLSNISVVDTTGRVYSAKNGSLITPTLHKNYQKIMEEINHSESNFSINTPSLNNSPYEFSIMYLLKDIFSEEVLGIVVVESNSYIYHKELEDLNTITSGKSKLVWNDSTLNPEKQNFSRGEHEILLKVPSKAYPLNLVISVPFSELAKDASRIQQLLLGIVSILLIIQLYMLKSLFRNIVQPILQLIKQMQSVKKENLNVIETKKRKDEIGLLYYHFNEMIRFLDIQKKENKRIMRKNREVELDALHSQINPHFIYNTLETIRMNAEVNDDEETSHMVFLLSQLMRYNMYKGFEITTLNNELKHLSTYLELLNYRFNNKFTLKIYSDNEFLNIKVMKMLFQPILENTVIHASKSPNQVINVSILFERIDQYLKIYISDDGVGMTDNQLKQVRENLMIDKNYPVTKKSGGIGLRNINERLHILYGNNYSLEIKSKQYQGTTIEISIILEGKEED